MYIEFRGVQYDIDDEIDCYFLNEHIVFDQYRKSKLDIGKRTDFSTKIYNKDLKDVLYRKAMHGSYEFARESVYDFDNERFECLSDDKCIFRKKTKSDFDTLIIAFPSFAGPEGRFTANRTNISEKLIDLETDLLVIHEDPMRMPESLYPSNLILGISDLYPSVETLSQKIRECIQKKYKNVVIYGESKHVAGSVVYALELSDIVTHVLLMSGQTTFVWEQSPWVKKYLKWANRPNHLTHQFLDMPDIQFMHIIKTNNFRKMNLSEKILNPFKFVDETNLKIDYYYGIYDSDYTMFKKHVENMNLKNVTMHGVDYKISDTQRHNIKPYIDRHVFPKYIKNLTN